MDYADGVGVWHWPLASNLISEAQKRKQRPSTLRGNRPLTSSIAFDCAAHSARAMTRVQRFCHNEKAGSSPGFFVVCGATTCKLINSAPIEATRTVDLVALTVSVRREVMRLDPARQILIFKTIEQRIPRHSRGRNHFCGVCLNMPPKYWSSTMLRSQDRHEFGVRQIVTSSAAANTGSTLESSSPAFVR